MSKQLSALWNGQLCPIEERGDHYEEIGHLCSLIEQNKGKLSEKLTESQRELLEKYDDAMYEMLSLSEESAFMKGFRLATRLWATATEKR